MRIEKNILLLHQSQGEIPIKSCISLLFRAYRKDLGNRFWNSSI
jgi:hypothetical protein